MESGNCSSSRHYIGNSSVHGAVRDGADGRWKKRSEEETRQEAGVSAPIATIARLSHPLHSRSGKTRTQLRSANYP
jgi:hypothetical protein